MTETNNANDAGHKSNDSNPSATKTTVVAADTTNKKRGAKKPRITLTRLTFVVAVLAAGGAIWQAWVSHDTEHQQFRAHIGLKRADDVNGTVIQFVCPDCDKALPGPLPAREVRNARDYIEFEHVKNFGATPAFRPLLCAKLMQNAPFTIDDIKGLIVKCRDAPFWTSTYWPGEEQRHIVTMDDDSITALQGARVGVIDAIVVGVIKYRDVFGDWHHTYICYDHYGAPPNEGVRGCLNVPNDDD